MERVSEEDKEIYPCADCGKMRSKNQGGTIFTVCDECWKWKHEKKRAKKLQGEGSHNE